SRITQLEADIARATKAEQINILAPVPGSDTVGIEIANNEKVAVPLHELLQDPAFASATKKIPLALGKDVYGNTVIGDLAAMPHLLVAGATGSGKSVCINSIISSILFKFSPNELRFIMIDPKVVEMQMYNSLPHLAVPVVTDPNKVIAALRWVVNEMERRYRMFAEVGVRNFDAFNKREIIKEDDPEVDPDAEEEVDEEYDAEHIESIAKALADGELGPDALDGADDEDEIEEIPDRVPYIVIIIDELADLMQTAPADMEMNIARIAQKARAAGIHLIVATQTPRADVVTGIIKANIPCRIAFQVSSKLDSRVILDVSGADKLVGKGDMLYLPPGSAKLERAQGAFIEDDEVEKLVQYCSNQVEQKFESAVQEHIESGGSSGDDDVSDADEEIVEKCLEVIRQEKKASTSLLQRRLRLGYTRAARMMDILEQRGIIGPGEGAKPREILINVGQDEA
ncbi:MAG: DNA translocase FtsK, partial [Verrucomicrobiaceae bacterium]|nr:DNA translocase FtsK [Verrucomicrobiaceae bacterium]